MMKKNILSILILFIAGEIFFFPPISAGSPGQEEQTRKALGYVEEMKAEIKLAQTKLSQAREGDDLSSYTLTSKSVPNIMRQFKSLSEDIKNIEESLKPSTEIQMLSSELPKIGIIIKELERVSKLNLKSSSQEQLDKLSHALNGFENTLHETEKLIVQMRKVELMQSMHDEVEEMMEEVRDALSRLAKAKEGDDLYEICITKENIPHLKAQFDSLSNKISEARKIFGSSQEIQTLSPEISKIGAILKDLERVAKENLKSDTQTQLNKLSDSLVALESKLKDDEGSAYYRL